MRVLNDVVCLTICVGIYDEPERKEKEETREKTNFYILYKYIYRDAIQCLFWVEMNFVVLFYFSFFHLIFFHSGKKQTGSIADSFIFSGESCYRVAWAGGPSLFCASTFSKWHWVLRCGQKVGGNLWQCRKQCGSTMAARVAPRLYSVPTAQIFTSVVFPLNGLGLYPPV